MRAPLPILGLAALSLAACENLSQEQNRALVGGGVGATGGALLGGIVADDPLAGAALGAAAGAAVGALTEEGDVPGEELLDFDDNDY